LFELSNAPKVHWWTGSPPPGGVPRRKQKEPFRNTALFPPYYKIIDSCFVPGSGFPAFPIIAEFSIRMDLLRKFGGMRGPLKPSPTFRWSPALFILSSYGSPQAFQYLGKVAETESRYFGPAKLYSRGVKMPCWGNDATYWVTFLLFFGVRTAK